ncbi:MAG: sel1 repeat family protein [Magnetococcales bacterium]|nr:sel1 repeat family protein [Magnetococcales bacterium]
MMARGIGIMLWAGWMIFIFTGAALAAGDALDKQAVVAAYKQKKYADVLRMATPHAQRGHAYAQFVLGLLHQNGEGVPQDYVQALKWFLEAARQGDAKAQYSVARIHFHGFGTARDPAKAYHWYRQAAEQGDLDSQVNVGRAYSQGLGVAEDREQALLWWRRAADAGHPVGQFNVGMHLLKHDRSSAGQIDALVYLQLAAAKEKDAAGSLKNAEQGLQPKELAEARARVAAWKPTPPWRAPASGSSAPAGDSQSPPPPREPRMTNEEVLSIIEKEFVQ